MTTTPEQARYAAKTMDFDVHASDVPGMLLSLAQQVEALTVERDLFKQHATLRMDQCGGLLRMEVADLIAERDALKPDAELYRHLRDHFAKTATDAKAEFARLEPLTGAQFDAVVRASIDAMGVEA